MVSKSAKQGHAAAQNYLGYMYEFGKGIEQNYVEAVKWYKKVAEQGNARAQCNLGNMYAHGQGVEQNYAEALKWYKLAAEQGYAIGQSNLGYMYDKGKGVDQSYEEALKWYQKAAEQGDKDAKEKLSILSLLAENSDLKFSDDKVFFGSHYENDHSIIKERIEWQILEKNGNKALLISKYVLSCKPYNTKDESITWENCTLRSWLNNDFLFQAFTSEERNMIMNTAVSADANPKYNISPGHATVDKVFLLSIPEVNRYFGSDSTRQCKGTKYYIEQIAYQNDGMVWWWLRSPGGDFGSAAIVDSGGSVDNYGYGVDGIDIAVRPALWVYLES